MVLITRLKKKIVRGAVIADYLMVFVAFSIILISFSCAKKDSEEIKIGVISVLSGEAVQYGDPAVKGIRLASEEINQAGGINSMKLTLIVEDDECSAQIGVSAANKLITQDKVKVIIGSICSSVTLAIAPVVNDRKVLLLSPQSAAPSIREAGDYVFRNWPSSDMEGKIAAQLIAKTMNYNLGAIIYINNDYGIGIKSSFGTEFKSLGGEIIFIEGFDEGTTDFRSILLKIKNSNAEFVYLASYLKEGARFLVQMKEMGIKLKVIAPDSMYDEKLAQLAGLAAEGIIVTTVAYDPQSDNERIKHFVNTYMEKYGEIPNNYAAHGYDAMHIIAQAISKVGYDSKRIGDFLYTVKDYPGVAGNTTFDMKGDVIKQPRITIIYDGKFKNYE